MSGQQGGVTRHAAAAIGPDAGGDRDAGPAYDRAIADKLGALMPSAVPDDGEGGATVVSIDR